MLVAWVGTAEAVTIRSHASLDSCVFTIGPFCPVETVGVSLLGAAVLAAMIIVVKFVLFGALRSFLGKRAIQVDGGAHGPDQCIEDLKMLWRERAHSSDAYLTREIDDFIVSAGQFSLRKYPELRATPNWQSAIWMMVFAAVMESGTHSKEAVNAAYRELSETFAKPAQSGGGR